MMMTRHGLSRRLMQVLAQSTRGRLGDIVMQTFSLNNTGGRRATPVWMHNLLGDPALKIPVTAP